MKYAMRPRSAPAVGRGAALCCCFYTLSDDVLYLFWFKAFAAGGRPLDKRTRDVCWRRFWQEWSFNYLKASPIPSVPLISLQHASALRTRTHQAECARLLRIFRLMLLLVVLKKQQLLLFEEMYRVCYNLWMGGFASQTCKLVLEFVQINHNVNRSCDYEHMMVAQHIFKSVSLPLRKILPSDMLDKRLFGESFDHQAAKL
jgi:hypothetical protein